VLRGDVSPIVAEMVVEDVLRLPVTHHGFEEIGERAWELHPAGTPDDAWYVALAEALDVPLATLDRRLISAPGPRCRFVTPTGG
jgi:predicted nucleic acid-binding protein